VMATPAIPVYAKENLRDPINIRMDIIHPEPVAAVAFPAAAIVRTQAQHGEAIRGIQEQFLGVPVQEELTALRFRVDIAEPENASLRARIKTTEYSPIKGAFFARLKMRHLSMVRLLGRIVDISSETGLHAPT
nr:hypothetical protein [Tanacetum cinerariifolium]